MRKLVLKFIFGFVILPLSIAGTLYYLNGRGFFNIQQIEVVLVDPVEGQRAYLKPLVEQLQTSLKPYEGVSLWNINLKTVVRTVKGNEWVNRVALKRAWPTTLQVHVQAHEVKLLYLGKNGKLLPVIGDGTFLDPVEAPQAPDVAVLDGEVFTKQSALRKKAVDVIEELPAEGSFSRKTVSEIRYDSKEGFWMTLIKTGIQVKIGEDQVALKAARVGKVVDYLESRQFDARVIDANLSKKVLVRLRKDP
ncbi:cell division protein FtsQ/DivIB [Bdellovibrio sp. HCB2-146]|uniref:cell division protein FtsQ/DivIB n=1 Tax=Bdellovibrio sp. HCB2-146 TaxID=3394362 RepID=UPI0039BC5B5C